MPASRLLVASTLLLITMTGLSTNSTPQVLGTYSPTVSSAIRSSLQWLAANQSSTGSYGDYFDHWTAAAAYALWLNNSSSQKASLSYSWLATQLNSSSSWFWGQYGEADVPGAMLHSVGVSHNLNKVNITGVSQRIVEFRQANGGFKGYFDPHAGPYGQSVASSVDTALALWGLTDAGTINASNRQAAIDYLVSLQNLSGSFNLTKTLVSDPIYSQAPEPVSITALVLLALKAASYTNNVHVTRALDFLTMSVSRNFTDANTARAQAHVYSASLTALALNTFGRSGNSSKVIAFVLSHQNPDGSFGDSIRHLGGSNALDTGWAAIALQSVPLEPLPTGQPSVTPEPGPLLIAGMVATIAVPVAVILGIAVYYRRRGESHAS